MRYWTQEREDMLVTLHAEKLPFSEIAKRMGNGITRNAVIGKAKRLGLPARVVPVERKPRPKKPVEPKDVIIPEEVAATVKQPEKAADELLHPPAPVRQVYDDPLARGAREAVMRLQPKQCRFPIGDVGDADFHFCPERQAPGETNYCAKHEKLTKGFTPTPRPRVKERERTSPRVAAGFR
jgi:GcrA cell cycle regulator